MAVLNSGLASLKAFPVQLPEPLTGKSVSLADFEGSAALLVVFMSAPHLRHSVCADAHPHSDLLNIQGNISVGSHHLHFQFGNSAKHDRAWRRWHCSQEGGVQRDVNCVCVELTC